MMQFVPQTLMIPRMNMSQPIIDSLDVDRTSSPLVLLLGQTGAGKSHFCNRVLGEDVQDVKESAHLSSCTSRPELISATVDGQEYLLIDTPGFNDTWRDFRRSDAKILEEIAQILTAQHQLGVNLRGILYLYDITAKRMTGETLRQFELIKRICGEKNYSNVLLVTTHWPERLEDQKKLHCAVREGDLRREFWKEMIRGGSTMCRFDDQHSTAKAIIRRLAGKPNVTLALQHEMARGKTLKGTTAFSFIVSARQQDEERLRKPSEIAASERLRQDSAATSSSDRQRQGSAASPSADRPRQAIGSVGDGLDAIDEERESIDIRKEGEDEIQDDIVSRVRAAIAMEDMAARRRNVRLKAIDLVRWLIGLANVATGFAQVGLAAN